MWRALFGTVVFPSGAWERFVAYGGMMCQMHAHQQHGVALPQAPMLQKSRRLMASSFPRPRRALAVRARRVETHLRPDVSASGRCWDHDTRERLTHSLRCRMGVCLVFSRSAFASRVCKERGACFRSGAAGDFETRHRPREPPSAMRAGRGDGGGAVTPTACKRNAQTMILRIYTCVCIGFLGVVR